MRDFSRVMLACALAATMTAGEASVASSAARAEIGERPMAFARVRGRSQACEPTCPEWISAEGTIVDASPADLRRVLDAVGGDLLPLIIHSDGGSIDAAVEMGRMIRDRGLSTVVGRTDRWSCRPGAPECEPADGLHRGEPVREGACRSACTIMFAGGLVRMAPDFAEIGVHMPYTMEKTVRRVYERRYRIEKGKKVYYKQKRLKRRIIGEKMTPIGERDLGQIRLYFEEMGIAPEIIDYFRSTPPQEMRRLLQSEKLELNLVTDRGGIDTIADPAACMAGRRAQNCVTRAGARVDPP